ncbi:Formylglycine-generating sulfatase enzyme [Variovorax sp. PBS-H4]|uniref:formylglycine-generating enzyme family protein n=1 Tax=Variovorax sp. PBS-H4 TaxID=434008 RepID=UPI0013162CAB|nr:SUMF1/EgtB/PvdO family nonheme iron enzyme [Variovorax sp. PBS-H4]VTU19989.1 Formylglycine-generating sulfatase enzyme [Variovorax sp. PBS-H4]
MKVLIVDRRLVFADMAARLQAGGWQLAADATAPPPLIEGEPEAAQFQRAGARLQYHFDPAMGMRQLRVSGALADDELAALASSLPCLGVEDARDLLRFPDVESRLLGLRMAEALDAPELLGDVAALMSGTTPTIARQAMRTFGRLIAQPGGAALRAVGHWKQDNPDKSAIFLLAGSTHNKLQILRWLAHDRRQSNEHIEAVLRTAFEDPDWEVRVTALVVAARLRADGLVGEVARVRLPEDTADGVNVDERRMLRTVQLCAIELLEGVAVPPASESPPTTKAAMREHLLRCLAGERVRWHEKAFLFVASLSTPLPDAVPPPGILPEGIDTTDHGYVLRGCGIALCWVPPIDHWLGEELPKMPVANPIRLQSSEGFFIARDLLAAPGRSDAEAGFLWDHRSALEHCRRLSATTGLTLRLPTADEWEMAARGPDARRFPWGNNARGERRFGASPWGVNNAVGRLAQWTATSRGEQVLVCGGEKQWVCAMRAPANRASLQALRIVIG